MNCLTLALSLLSQGDALVRIIDLFRMVGDIFLLSLKREGQIEIPSIFRHTV